MLKKILFNIFVMFIGALSGTNSFLLIMLGVEKGNIEIALLSTIIVIVLFIVTAGTIYALIVLFLKYIDKYSFLIQTISFIVVTILLLFLFPIITGIGYLDPMQFFFELDGQLTCLAIVFTNLICSYGIWVSEQQHSKKPFYVIAAFTLITSAIIF